MANYTTADIKALREKTGAGMLDVKKALDEADGDLKRAEEILADEGPEGRGQARGPHDVQRPGRRCRSPTAAPARSAPSSRSTARPTSWPRASRSRPWPRRSSPRPSRSAPTDPETLLASEIEAGTTVQQVVDQANAAIGEKIVVSKVARVEGAGGHVVRAPDQPGPAAADRRPGGLRGQRRDGGPRRRDAHRGDVADGADPRGDRGRHRRRPAPRVRGDDPRGGQARAGDPRIVEGRVNAFFKENVLLEQEFAKDPKKSVAQVLKEAGATATNFARFKVGV